MARSVEPMSDGLLRQRRNLFALSALIWFLKFGEVEIDKLSFLGIEFKTFSNPDAIYVAIWLAWFYFAFRYYQYFVQEGFPKLYAAYTDLLDEICAPKVTRLVRKEYPNDFREDCGYRTLKKWKWVYHGQQQTGQDKGSGEMTVENFEMQFSPWWLWKEILWSIWHIVINRSVVTDYILPILLALYILVTAWSGWEGGISEIYQRSAIT
ncbi:hypothetical protein [Aliidiomarina soli]|nr:hypothetical protein [Aliidiomarina soli]